jgi:hypothetical protein
LDESLAHAINSIHLEQEVVPREWYERLWRDFRIIDEDREIVRARWKKILLFLLIICIIICIIIFYFIINYIYI